jgi:hypothetical protein
VSNPEADSPEYLVFHQTLVAAYNAGVPDKDVARIFDVSNTLVRRWRTKQLRPHQMFLNSVMRECVAELKTVLAHIAIEEADPELLKLSSQFRLTIDSAFQAGMTEKDVNQLLGKPRQVVTRITDSEWRYSPASWSATVTFRNGRVIGFKEPLP